jgi:hypothetical protein
MDSPRPTIASKILSGALPLEKSERIWEGDGDGRPCAGCDLPVLGSAVEAAFRGLQRLRFHRGCFAIWRVETSGLLRHAGDPP